MLRRDHSYFGAGSLPRPTQIQQRPDFVRREPEFPPEVAEALSGYLREEGVTLHCGVAYQGVMQDGAGVALRVRKDNSAEILTAERVLIATGRRPNVEGLGLEEAGVAQASDGCIRVDDRMRTTRSGVYAAGDVTGQDQFVYMAAYGAKIAAKNVLNGDGMRYDNTSMPAVVFTDPQVASDRRTAPASCRPGPGPGRPKKSFIRCSLPPPPAPRPH